MYKQNHRCIMYYCITIRQIPAKQNLNLSAAMLHIEFLFEIRLMSMSSVIRKFPPYFVKQLFSAGNWSRAKAAIYI